MNDQPRKPRSFRLSGSTVSKGSNTARKNRRKPAAAKAASIKLKPVADSEANGMFENLTPPPPLADNRGFRWGALLFAAIAALASLALGLAVDQLVRDLFERNTWLGWSATVMAAIAVLAIIILGFREIRAVARMRQITHLRKRAEKLRTSGKLSSARHLVNEISGLYGQRPDMAHARQQFSTHKNDVMQPGDLVGLAESDLLFPLDKLAIKLVMDAAKRVSLVTALSPRAIIDIAYVFMENMRLIRKLSALYGGRPGMLGFWQLARKVLTHLAATGAIAIGDGLVQQMIGHGLAAKLSARLGEGVINGMLTARIGIAAMDVCRPMAFTPDQRPGISEFMKGLVKFAKPAETPAE